MSTKEHAHPEHTLACKRLFKGRDAVVGSLLCKLQGVIVDIRSITKMKNQTMMCI
jgi:hypothetical protein